MDKEPFTVGFPPTDYMTMENGFNGNLELNSYRTVAFSDLIEESPYVCEDIKILMNEIGLIPESWDIPIEKFGVVAYHYPENSEFDSGIFLTSLGMPVSNVIDGLPGSSTEVLNNRMYAGFTFLKGNSRNGSKVQYHECLGNGITKARSSSLDFDSAHMALSNLLLGFFYPKKEI